MSNSIKAYNCVNHAIYLQVQLNVALQILHGMCNGIYTIDPLEDLYLYTAIHTTNAYGLLTKQILCLVSIHRDGYLTL